MQRVLLVLCAIAGFAPAIASAEMSCAALGSYLATQPNLSQFVPPPPAAQVPVPFTALVPATSLWTPRDPGCSRVWSMHMIIWS